MSMEAKESFVGQVVSGSDKGLVLREKKGAELELGNLLAIENDGRKYLAMVSGLEYGSLVNRDRLFTSAGSMLEGSKPNIEFPESDLRLFRSVSIKSLIEIKVEGGRQVARPPRSIPRFMSKVREANEKDFSFMEIPKTKIFLGRVRSGSRVMGFDFSMDGDKMLSHHVLISAQTGRGKSNLVKVMLWETMMHDKFGILVMDAHNEYYGTGSEPGLRDHPNAKGSVVYYSRSPPPGQKLLKINLKSIIPDDVLGILELSEPQEGTIQKFRRLHGREWIRELMTCDEDDGSAKGTLRALKRKFGNLFNLREMEDGTYSCEDKVFDMESMGEGTIKDIASAMEAGKVVLIDSSSISDDTSLIIASAVLRTVFDVYEGYKTDGTIDSRPQIGVVLEEAPRVLSGAYGPNIFSKIAREGRKFKIGLVAITQLVSVIPKEILANIGTKVIMGNEMAFERRALIESAAQDLSAYDYIIAGLDKGEAIVSSIFSKFPVPIYTPLFEEHARRPGSVKKAGQVFF